MHTHIDMQLVHPHTFPCKWSCCNWLLWGFARVYSLLYLACLHVSQFVILGQRTILASPHYTHTPHTHIHTHTHLLPPFCFSADGLNSCQGPAVVPNTHRTASVPPGAMKWGIPLGLMLSCCTPHWGFCRKNCPNMEQVQIHVANQWPRELEEWLWCTAIYLHPWEERRTNGYKWAVNTLSWKVSNH